MTKNLTSSSPAKLEWAIYENPIAMEARSEGFTIQKDTWISEWQGDWVVLWEKLSQQLCYSVTDKDDSVVIDKLNNLEWITTKQISHQYRHTFI